MHLLPATIDITPDRVRRREFNRRTLFERANGTEYYDAIETSISSLMAYGEKYSHWVITYSGGKDSSAVLSFVLWSIDQGYVPAPGRLSVLYADTRMELPPLVLTANKVLKELEQRGIETIRVEPPMEKRFWVQILGRGLPPPKRGTRWCTRVLKADPMMQVEQRLREKHGDSILLLTGVRKGESVVRDERIRLSCSKNDGECGQGWYQQSRHALAPLMHWRVCHVWKWIYSNQNLMPVTREIEAVYRADDIVDIRTGCIACNIVDEDMALKFLVRVPGWSYLAPLIGLRDIYDEMYKRQYRLRHGIVTLKDGSVSAAKTGKVGPLTIDARRYFLWRVQQLEADANYQMIPEDEETMIRQMWRDKVYPRDWTGNESLATEMHTEYTIENGRVTAQQLPLPAV
jgi:DNA sulfur modification protein DndC